MTEISVEQIQQLLRIKLFPKYRKNGGRLPLADFCKKYGATETVHTDSPRQFGGDLGERIFNDLRNY